MLLRQLSYAIKNQLKAPKAPTFVPTPLVGDFGCLELVLYGIVVVLEQFLRSNLNIELRTLTSGLGRWRD